MMSCSGNDRLSAVDADIFATVDSGRAAADAEGTDTNLSESVREEEVTSNNNQTAAADAGVVTATSEWTKQRVSTQDSLEVGAVQVDEEAPQLNRRFYLGLHRASVIFRRRQARARRRTQAADAEGGNVEERRQPANGDGGGAQSQRLHSERGTLNSNEDTLGHPILERVSGVFANMGNAVNTAGEYLVQATLVPDDAAERGERRDSGLIGEVVVAERMNFFERRWKSFAFLMCTVIVVMAVVFPLVLTSEATPAPAPAPTEDPYCDPCINRTFYTIMVLVDGATNGDYAADMILPEARQMAQDMGVDLVEKNYPIEKSVDQMADDIRAAAAEDSDVDALIVTIPSEIVASAVRYAARSGMPVFGMNLGIEFAKGLIEDGSMLFFTAADDRMDGNTVASYFLEELNGIIADENDEADLFKDSHTSQHRVGENFTNALYVSMQQDIFEKSVHELRYEGYRDRLMEASNGTVNVERIEISEPNDPRLTRQTNVCKHQTVLVGSGKAFPWVHGHISKSNCNKQIREASFDRTDGMDRLVKKGELFVMDQFQRLQGWAPILFATLYTTTGTLPLPPSSIDGLYLSGTSLVTQENLIAKSIFRENITIGGVLHGTTTQTFWDPVFSAARQSAIDMGIELILNRFYPQENKLILYENMVEEIRSLCKKGVHGLFVTLPDDDVIDAVRDCKVVNPGVQIISINAGYEKSKELNLIHHIGMVERDAGYEAGLKMVEMAKLDRALCLNHSPGFSVFDDRCEGFGQAMNDTGSEAFGNAINDTRIEYLGQVELRGDSILRTVDIIEEKVGEAGDWDGYGILLVSLEHLNEALELKKLHPGVAIGTFDTSDDLYKSLEKGDILFGIDQQPYLQGYLPLPILIHAAIDNQYFLNHHIKSGPKFVTVPPLKEKANCAAQNFPVCSEESPPPAVTNHSSVPIQPALFQTIQPSGSMRPSSSPSFDLRPTLEIVQERGHVRCGLKNETIASEKGFHLDLCRSIAAVLLGNPDNFVGVPVSVQTRFVKLNDRDVDLLLRGDTHTIEREVRERTTGVGFTFSSPYYYDGMVYFGNETFVECAEKRKRHDHCSSLRICVLRQSTSLDYVEHYFPSDFFIVVSSTEQQEEMLLNDSCNVVAADGSYLLGLKSKERMKAKKFVVGKRVITSEPLAVVTLKGNREFSDIINWVVHALFYGEEQGLSKNSSLCQTYKELASHASDLNFMNAVYCVGNYGDIIFVDEQSNRGMNQINNGTTGMLYATPFGEIEFRDDFGATAKSLLDRITDRKVLNCGVIVPNDSDGGNLFGMSVEYCHILAAALFMGDSTYVNVTNFSENDKWGFVGLNNGTIDVLAGARVEKRYDFASSESEGFQFSTPYFYGNEATNGNVSFYSLASREQDALFSSFVNSIVLATIYAKKNNIVKENSIEMPSASIFGNKFGFALKDAIHYSGNYGELYMKNFVHGEEDARGRNTLNSMSGPQMHSFPGLSP